MEDNLISFRSKKQHNRTLSLQDSAYLKNKYESNTGTTSNTLHKRVNTSKAQNGGL